SAGLELLRGLIQHAHSSARIAFLRADDRPHVVPELLVLGETLRRAREDAVRHVGLAAQQRQVRMIFCGTGRALASEPVTVGDLASLHPCAREAEARVSPDR